MKPDLVQKLRTWKGKALTHVVLNEAADEIESLRLLAAKNMAVAKAGDLIIITIPDNFPADRIGAVVAETKRMFKEFRFLFLAKGTSAEIETFTGSNNE